jgi:hypothetical protein
MGQRRATSLPWPGGSSRLIAIPLGYVSRSFDYSDGVRGNPEVDLSYRFVIDIISGLPTIRSAVHELPERRSREAEEKTAG